MSSKLLDYLILAIIFAVVIHIFIRTVQSTKCYKNEHLETVNSTNSDELEYTAEDKARDDEARALYNKAYFDKHGKVNPYAYAQSQQPIPDDEPYTEYINPTASPISYGQSDEYTEYIKQRTMSQVTESPELSTISVLPSIEESSQNSCMVNGVDINNDRYIREFVFGGKYNCEPENTFNNNDIQNYQNDFFKFNEKINNSTNGGVDVVDRLNENLNEINPSFGKKMSDVYDELTGVCTERKNQCVNKNCLIPPVIDSQFRGGVYTDDNSYKKYNYRYEDDEVSNGGKFYDNIEASDDEFEPNMMWK
jgi:hypothetical protein